MYYSDSAAGSFTPKPVLNQELKSERLLLLLPVETEVTSSLSTTVTGVPWRPGAHLGENLFVFDDVPTGELHGVSFTAHASSNARAYGGNIVAMMRS